PARDRPPLCSTLFPYTTLFRSIAWVSPRLAYSTGPRDNGGSMTHEDGRPEGRPEEERPAAGGWAAPGGAPEPGSPRPSFAPPGQDRKSTRLNSSHVKISYAVFC